MPDSLIDLGGIQVGAGDFLAAVLETVAQPICVVDPDGVIRFANPAAIAVLGYDSVDELCGRHSHETIHHSHPDGTPYPAEDCPMLLPRVTGETVARDLDWFFRRDGSMIPVSYVSAPIEMRKGRGAVVAFTDVEERLAEFTTPIADECSRTAGREQAARLADEQAALRRVATLVARESSPDDVFAVVAEEVGRLLGVEHSKMWRFEADGSATVVAQWGDHDPAVTVGTRMSLEGKHVAARVRRTERPARIDGYATASGDIGAHGRRLGTRCAVGAPIIAEGRLWGALIAASRRTEPLPPDTETRIGEFTDLVATAIANIEARTDLAASRARLVAAADEERRRVVRDLHDGAQQRLVHASITLQHALQELEPTDRRVKTLVREALDHTNAATSDLRELAHGIIPAVLARGGLRSGIKALASRMPVPVTIDVAVERLPTAVEATGYFVVAEALTNVAKHAHAGHAEVTADVENGTLRVRVRDDGVGGARPDGNGLVGLGDRLAAVDGRLSVESRAGRGTLLAADIPLRG